MLPIQEIQINTKNNQVFSVHLEKWDQNHFECKLAAISLGSQVLGDATFGPFTKDSTALDACQELISKLNTALAKLDAADSIPFVDNPCNTEFITAAEQKRIFGKDFIVKVNGIDT